MRILSGIQPYSSDSLFLRWHSTSRRTIWVCSLACLAISAVCIYAITMCRDGNTEGCSPQDSWIPLVFAASFGLVGLYMIPESQTIIDPAQRRVRRELILFDWLVLYEKSYEFSAFKSVFIKRNFDDEGSDTVFVGLRRLKGWRLWIRYWNTPHKSPCEPAEQMAEQLAAKLGVFVEKSDQNELLVIQTLPRRVFRLDSSPCEFCQASSLRARCISEITSG